MPNKYDNNFKYKMIALLCEGKSAAEVKREYGVTITTIMKWLRTFVSDGLFSENELSPDEKVNLEKLRKSATRKEVEMRRMSQTSDITLMWVLEFDDELGEWRYLAEEWLKTQIRGKSIAINGLSGFFQKYLVNTGIPRSPKDFLLKEFYAPDFFEICFSHYKSNHALKFANKISSFIEWVLLEKFSVEDDLGNKHIPHELHNPLAKYIPDSYGGSKHNESDKNILPYRYIKDLRSILCPPDATHFKDWHFAQEATDSKSNGRGDWFLIEQSLIDENDPDCVFRKRDATKYEKGTKGLPDIIYELWSPVVSVALLTKLLLPLRTYQVRMLDSGEMDTFKYVQPTRIECGHWVMNDSPLSKGDKESPFEKGVLRKFNDPTSKMEMTGLFINTNKTADINKEEDKRGYEIPWQYEEVQYWLAKLRDWQQKYNSVSGPTPWENLKKNHLGFIKDKKILKQTGSTMFLFRNPSSPGEEHFPVSADGLSPLWHKLLTELEDRLITHGSKEETCIRFIKNKKTTLYPLHSLRVSLITAYAIEGGVPMPILSKAIVGHARLVMTLYYTKAGISFVTDKMNQAEHNILENEKASFERFLRDAKYEQLENNIVINDPIAYQAVINAQQSGASIIIGDKGICPKGNFGCESGGVFVNDDTDQKTFGPVPGFPEHNCARCRWFVTGPAFLPGLVHHFNTLGYNMRETGKRVIQYQNEIETLENHKYECEVNEQIFTEQGKLLKFETLHMQEVQKNDKLANDYNATLRLIDKCITLTKNSTAKESVQLVPVGSIDDIRLTLENVEHEFELLQIICNGAEVFPETDASKAVLQRSQIIDLTLTENGKKPVMFSLTDEEQLIAGNQFMRLLMQQVGSFKNAVPYAIGRKKLEEIGLINEFVEEIESMKINEAVLALEQDAAT